MTQLAEPVVRHWDFPRGVGGTTLLVRFGVDNGVGREQLLAGSGLTEAQLSDPATEVAARQELAVVRNLATALPDAGVAAGREYHATTFGILGFAFLSSPTMRDAVAVALRYFDLSFAFSLPRVSLADGQVRLELDDRLLPADVARFLVERDLAAIHTVIDELVPGGVPLTGLTFRFAAPDTTEPSTTDFGLTGCGPTQPGATGSGATRTGATEPGPTESVATGSGLTGSGAAGSSPAESGTAGSGPTGSGMTGSGAVGSGASIYRTVFGVTPEFGRDANMAMFDATYLDRPLPLANAHTVAMCEAQCRELVSRRRARSGFAHDVRESLTRLGALGSRMPDVARQLNISTRTLRRRLEEEGTTFRALLDEVREALAEELLTAGAVPVEDVATRLGYAEASSFIHAFKRWKGVTPTAFVQRRDRFR